MTTLVGVLMVFLILYSAIKAAVGNFGVDIITFCVPFGKNVIPIDSF